MRLSTALQKRDAALERAKGRIAKLRTRLEERSKKTSERWAEILRLRRQIKTLDRELEEARVTLEQPPELNHGDQGSRDKEGRSKTRLTEPMQPRLDVEEPEAPTKRESA